MLFTWVFRFAKFKKSLFFTLNSYDDLLLPDKSEILDVTVYIEETQVLLYQFLYKYIKVLVMQVSIQKQQLENRK